MSTLRLPQVAPNLKQDCLELNRAFQGLGCDATKIITILAHRTASQRAEIKKIYENQFHEDLCQRLESELHFHFEKAMLQWMREPAERDAVTLRDSLLKSFLTAKKRNEILIEIFTQRNQEELRAIEKAYYTKLKRCLEVDVEAVATNFCQKFFDNYLHPNRDNDAGFSEIQARGEAKELYEAAGEGRMSVDEAVLLRILTTRSIGCLRSIFDTYKKIYRHEIYEGFRKCNVKRGSEEQRDMLVAITWSMRYPEKYSANVLYEALTGFATDEDALVRVVISRAEIDMKYIKNEFLRQYNTSLDRMISLRTSANLREFLLALIGADE